MSIDRIKIIECMKLCIEVLYEGSITKKGLQSLLGKLNHTTKLNPSARRFMNGLFTLLPSFKDKNVSLLSEGAIDDLLWFSKFLYGCNGKAFIRSFTVCSVTLEIDSCLVGGGHSVNL